VAGKPLARVLGHLLALGAAERREIRVGPMHAGAAARRSALPSPAMSPLDYLGIHIDTIVQDNVAIRCDGCLEVIEGTPWRMNILDVVAAETPVSWAGRPPINPGPFEFHSDGAHVRRWMRDRGYLFCRKGEVREIMRPIPIPGPVGAPLRYGLCDGLHRDDHELVPA
jgi:hypothetical protein